MPVGIYTHIMKPYELTYIIASNLKSEDAENLKKEVEVFVQGKEGAIVKSEKTVPQGLAYPIKKHSSGYFCTLEFQMAEAHIKPLKEVLEKNTSILRHFLMVKKPIKVMKERRTRKPAVAENKLKPASENTEVYKIKPKKEEAKLEDIDKKLDEILSE